MSRRLIRLGLLTLALAAPLVVALAPPLSQEAAARTNTTYGTAVVEITDEDVLASGVTPEDMALHYTMELRYFTGLVRPDETWCSEEWYAAYTMRGPLDDFTIHLEIDFDQGTFTGWVQGYATYAGDPEYHAGDWGEGTVTGTFSGRVYSDQWDYIYPEDPGYLIVNPAAATAAPGTCLAPVRAWTLEGTADVTLEWLGRATCRADYGDGRPAIYAEGSTATTFEAEVRAGDYSSLGESWLSISGWGNQPREAAWRLDMDAYGLVDHPALTKAFPIVFAEGYCDDAGSAGGAGENQPPEIAALSLAPTDPDSHDTVVFTVNATDPEGDKLNYTWVVDGETQSTGGAQTSWNEPPPGDHTVQVTVNDGKGGTAEAFLDFRVGEATGAGDRDDDGVPDDEDLCPDEWGEGDDGCPDFAVTMGCQPARPTEEQAVSCTAAVTGVHVGETLEYNWYLNTNRAGTTSVPSWNYGVLEPGDQLLDVEVIGEGRSARASFYAEVLARQVFEEAAEIADDLNAGFSIVLGCTPEISSDDDLSCSLQILRDDPAIDALAVTWVLNGLVARQETALNYARFNEAKPPPGRHTVQAQVVHMPTGKARVAAAVIDVEAGENVNPFTFTGGEQVPAAAQVAAAVGTLSTLMAGFWAEWMLARRAKALEVTQDRWLRQDRQKWFDRETDRWLQQVRAQDQMEVLEATVKNAWHTEFERLRKAAETNPALEKYLDMMDDGYDRVYKNGQWNLDEFIKLRREIGLSSMVDSSRAYSASLKKLLNTLGPTSKALLSASQSFWWRLGTGVITGGWSESFWIPLSTMDKLWTGVKAGVLSDDPEMRKMARLESTYRHAARAAIKETIGMIMWDTVFVQAGKAFRPELISAKQMLKRAAVETAESLKGQYDDMIRGIQQRLNQWRSAPAPDVPIIRQSWGSSVVSFSPQVSAAGRAPVPMNWVQQLDELARLDRVMADRINNMMRQPGRINIQRPLSMRPNQTLTLTPDEWAAHSLLENPSYRQAVSNGLVPKRIVELTNHTRMKLAEAALGRAWNRMAEESPELASRVLRVDFTGTGARPSNPAALGGHTDIDLTVMGDRSVRVQTSSPGELLEQTRLAAQQARQAERMLQGLFERELAQGSGRTSLADLARGADASDLADLARRAGMPDLSDLAEGAGRVDLPGLSRGADGRFLADINAFAGTHPSAAPSHSAYGSPELIEFVKMDNVFRGRTAIMGSKGTVYFGGHPDVHPAPGYGPLEPLAPTTPNAQRAAADIRRLILQHLDDLPGPPTAQQVALSEGKHLWRHWWSTNKGSINQSPVPEVIQIANRLKVERGIPPPPDDVRRVVEALWRQFDLPGNPPR